MQRLNYLVLLCFVTVMLCGCGGPATGAVAGTVTFDGKPFSDAAVIFLDMTTGQGGNTNLKDDGSFQLPKPLPVGDYKVYLAPKLNDDNSSAEPEAVSMSGGGGVPSRYWSESSTDITKQVVAGENSFKIEIPAK